MSFRELPGTPKSTVGNAEVEVQFYKAEIEPPGLFMRGVPPMQNRVQIEATLSRSQSSV
jgi:hypothetical protein